ncbi:MAG: flagellar basal-body rod protein FlgG [Lachnospiraceae bacterium]|nr:flagellar basal-body rod protein FlgG [Lachnospiraceae bacterium]
MMRSLWTAASGMRAQQTNVDTISNNLANVNTIGYKKETTEFKSLLYQTIQAKTTSANGDTKPVGAQIGLGVKNASITSIFTQGNINQTENDTDFAIQGDGFFTLMDIDGETVYSRNGQFLWTTSEGGVMLANSNGLPVLDTNGSSIEFDTEEYDVSKITIDANGQVCYPDETNNPKPLGIQIGLVQFANPSGLEKQGGSLYKMTDASGEPVYEIDGVVKQSVIKQGFIENSNVQVVDEMVNLIVAQRAYEMNSKAITTTDEMMKQANQLKS